jgi:hypothetical protein
MIIAVCLFGFGAIWAAAYCAISIGLGADEAEPQNRRVGENKMPPESRRPQTARLDAMPESDFTNSLLALGKVRTLDPYKPPVIAPAESSAEIRDPQPTQ